MIQRKPNTRMKIGGLVLLIALVSMACGLSVNAPDFPNQLPEGFPGVEPTFTSQAPSGRQPSGRPLPTIPPESRDNSGADAQVTATPGLTGQIPQTGGMEQQGGLAQPPAQAPGSLTEVYAQANPGTVSILVGGQQGEGAGSGFIITEDGFIATNYHVAADADILVVRFFNDVDARAEVVGADPDSDLAIIKVDQLPEGTHPLPLGDSSQVLVGETVVAIGNPFGLGTSMSMGIVSAIGRTIPSLTQQYNIPQAIQTDAAINPGNSGGPLINMRGEVIGINAQIRTSGGVEGNIGIGFAIPVNILKLIYPTLIQNGTYTWPYLGVSSPAGVPLAVSQDNPQSTQGALVADLVGGGPADQAGLEPGDIVTAVDGQRITNFDTLLAYIMTKRPGDQIKLNVMRNNQEGQVTVTLGERPRGQEVDQ